MYRNIAKITILFLLALKGLFLRRVCFSNILKGIRKIATELDVGD